ncbi:translocation/assembly module TamB domain-containing protein [Thioalkalicoccus limnaeus]|uniref:Translocation/assembly module TamB domain-containing protein n=1 Tax=Thioalkalicoccus limnaeus TaxID=120681 RepID=A0ABV4BA54_9GAMM
MFGGLGVAGLLCLVWLVSTHTGLRVVLAAMAEWAPDLIQVEQAEGRLLDGLSLTGVEVRHPAFEVRIDRLELDWRPLGALLGTLRVERLAVDALQVILIDSGPDPDDAPRAAAGLPSLAIPIGLVVVEAGVARLGLLRRADGQESRLFEAEDVLLAGRWHGRGVALEHLRVRHPGLGLRARAAGQVEMAGVWPLSLALEWATDEPAGKPPLPPLVGSAHVDGDLADRLVLVHSLTGAVRAVLEASVEHPLERPRWEADLVVQGVDLPMFDPALPSLELAGRVGSRGALDAATLAAALDAAVPDRPDWGRYQAHLDLALHNGRMVIEDLSLTERDTEARLSVSGHLDLAAAPLAVELAGSWSGWRWPLIEEAVIRSPVGRFEATGSLADLRYRLSGELAGDGWPAVTLDLTGTGDPQGTQIEALEAATLTGRVGAHGTLQWTPQWRWQIDLVAEDLNPGGQWPDWSGRIGGQLVTHGSLTDEGPDLEVLVRDLSGVLRGYPVAARGRLGWHRGRSDIERVVVTSGSSVLRADGHIGDALEMDVELDSPDLSNLWPAAIGRLQAAGRLRGTAEAPEVELRFELDEVEVLDQSIRRLAGEARFGLAPSAPLRLDLSGTGVVVGGLDWERLDLKGDGMMADHRLTFASEGPRLGIDAAFTGGLAADRSYAGRLTGLGFASPDLGEWRLTRPGPFRVAPPTLEVGPLCVGRGGAGTGCIEFSRAAADRWALAFDVDRLVLEELGDPWPIPLAATGQLQLRGRFEAVGDRLGGSANLALPLGRLQWADGPMADQPLDLSGARVDLTLGNDGLIARTVVPLTGLGALEADVTLAGWRPDAPARPDQPLRGRVQVGVHDLGWFGRLIPDLSQLRGRIDSDLTLSGTLSDPGLLGSVRLAGAGFDVPMIGLVVRDLDLAADATARNRFQYQGQAGVGGRRLDLSGEALRRADGWFAAAQLSGTNLRVADTPEYRVRISPDLDLGFGPEGVKVAGEIRIPDAEIRPRTLPEGTVTPSPDVVMKHQERADPLPVTVDLRLILGQDVRIDAFGVGGLLRGDLRVRQDPARDFLRGDGQLQIIDGRYRIGAGLGSGFGIGSGLLATIGRPLIIEQGRLVFADTPLANPGLLLQATREGGDLTAGVQVLGTLREPRLTFFSESDPGMTQAEITNFLVTGIPPRGDSDQDDRSLAVGTYIAPRLFMEYVTSLDDDADRVRLRYELMRNVEIQTETGSAQGGDIFLKFER